jgi:hypothetical protein
MIRALLSWLDRRIDARLDARESARASDNKKGLAGKALAQFEKYEPGGEFHRPPSRNAQWRYANR